MTKVLGVSCSPRKGGNTEILLQQALAGAGERGAETELVTIFDKEIKPCDGCYACQKTGKCHIKDDMQGVYDKFLAADGIIWGTPVYYFGVAAQAKILIDRSFALSKGTRLTNKVGGVISVAASLGHQSVWNTFNSFFSVHHMLAADFVYGFGREKGEVRKDKHAMKAAGELGKQVVLLAEQKFKFPEQYDTPIYRYVLREYGINNCPALGRFEE